MLIVHIIKENGSVEERRVNAVNIFHKPDGGHIRPIISVSKDGEVGRPLTCHEQAEKKRKDYFFEFFDNLEKTMGEAING